MVAAVAEVAAGAAASVVAAVAGALAAEVAAAAVAVAADVAVGSFSVAALGAWAALVARLAGVAAPPGERAACARSHEKRRCDGRRITSGLPQPSDEMADLKCAVKHDQSAPGIRHRSQSSLESDLVFPKWRRGSAAIARTAAASGWQAAHSCFAR